MKPAYISIPTKSGLHVPGLCKVQVCPIDDVSTEFEPKFVSNIIESPVTLINNKSFITLQFLPRSYSFSSVPKESKNGTFFETKVTGTLNNMIPNIQIVLETLRYQELLVNATDNLTRNRLIGNKTDGARLIYAEKDNTNERAIDVTLEFSSETAPPFYVDNGNFIPQDLNGIYFPGQTTNVGGSNTGNVELVPFSNIGDTAIAWTNDRKLKFGDYPTITVWAKDNGVYYQANFQIETNQDPPTQYIIRNGGGEGVIKLTP